MISATTLKYTSLFPALNAKYYIEDFKWIHSILLLDTLSMIRQLDSGQPNHMKMNLATNFTLA